MIFCFVSGFSLSSKADHHLLKRQTTLSKNSSFENPKCIFETFFGNYLCSSFKRDFTLRKPPPINKNIICFDVHVVDVVAVADCCCCTWLNE